MKNRIQIVLFSGVLILATLLLSGCTHSTNKLVFERDQMQYVIDTDTAAVSVFTAEGKLSSSIGSPGAGVSEGSGTLPPEIIHYLLVSNGAISGLVWHDINGNRLIDPGESGVQNIHVYIDTDNSASYTPGDPSAITDANGSYAFPRVKKGTTNVYIDTLTVPGGYVLTTSNPQTIRLSRNDDISDADFGIQDRSGYVNGTVWDQTDNVGMPGIVVYLDQDSDAEQSPGEPFDITDSSGNYLIQDLPGGNYKFNIDDETVNSRYYQPPGAGTTPTDIFLPPGGNLTIDRLYVHKATIRGVVLDINGNPWGFVRLFIDLNGNGIYDAGEPVAVTDEFGNYFFDNLPPGSYTIIIPLPDGYNILASPGTITVADGENYVSANFLTQTQPAAIASYVWDDANGNGVREPEENGLPAITVFLDANNNGIPDASEPVTVTDGTGAFSFTALDPGNFYIRVDDTLLLNAYTPTTASNPVQSNIYPGQTYTGASFGYQSKLAMQHALISPTRLTWGSNGNLYVSDNINGSIFIYDSTLTPLGELKKLAKPLGIITDNDGNIYVGNNGRRNVEVYDPDGNLLRTIGDGSIALPNDFAFDRDNNFYILDSSNDTVLVYDQNGTFISAIGDSLLFDYAISIAINYRDDGSGTEVGELYVADQPNCTIHVFSLDGTYVRPVGTCGSLYTSNWDGKFAGLVAVETDQYDYIHGLDNSLNVVQVFDPATGAFVRSYNAYPAGSEMLLNLQSDMSINQSDNRVVISNIATKSVETIATVPIP